MILRKLKARKDSTELHPTQRTMAAQTYTVYIPRLHSDTDESYIRWQFDYYNLAHVARVDWVFKYNDAGQLIFKQAFVHLMWMENDTAQRLKTKIDNEEQARLIHDDPVYWILLKARNPLPQSVVNEADRLMRSGDIGDILDHVLLSEDWDCFDETDLEETRGKYRAVGLAFNSMRQQLQETGRQHGINQTLLTATARDLEFYRGWHGSLQEKIGEIEAAARRWEQIAAGRLVQLTEQCQRNERLVKQVKELEHQRDCTKCMQVCTSGNGDAPWMRHGVTCVDGEVEEENIALRQKLSEAEARNKVLDRKCVATVETIHSLRNHIHNQKLVRPLHTSTRVHSDRAGDDPIASRAAISSPPAVGGWTVVEDSTTPPASYDWRTRRSYKYGEEYSDDGSEDSYSSMTGLDDDTRPTYTKEQHKADVSGRAAGALSTRAESCPDLGRSVCHPTTYVGSLGASSHLNDLGQFQEEEAMRIALERSGAEVDAAFHSAAVLGAEEVEEGAVDFSPAESFQGRRTGFVFTHGAHGTGYYAHDSRGLKSVHASTAARRAGALPARAPSSK